MSASKVLDLAERQGLLDANFDGVPRRLASFAATAVNQQAGPRTTRDKAVRFECIETRRDPTRLVTSSVPV